jgi:dTDP-4-dehydrorhamnose reductase
MLGHKLMQVLGDGHEVTGTARRQLAPTLAELLPLARVAAPVCAEDAEALVQVLARVKPQIVINCIGVIKQSAFAKDPETTIRVNALFPHVLARLCREAGARMIHISTDCVFSGLTGNYRETDVADAADVYGRSKLLGEVTGEGALTLRTSIIGRELKGRHGLLEWFLSNRGGAVKGYRGAIYSGLTTIELARVIGRVLVEKPNLSGLWQVASAPIDKYELLKKLNAAYGLGIRITPDDSVVCDRSLDGSRFREATGYVAPSWDEMVAELAADPTPYDKIRDQRSEVRGRRVEG